MHTYIHACMHTYILTFTFIHSDVPTVPTYLPTYLPTQSEHTHTHIRLHLHGSYKSQVHGSQFTIVASCGHTVMTRKITPEARSRHPRKEQPRTKPQPRHNVVCCKQAWSKLSATCFIPTTFNAFGILGRAREWDEQGRETRNLKPGASEPRLKTFEFTTLSVESSIKAAACEAGCNMAETVNAVSTGERQRSAGASQVSGTLVSRGGCRASHSLSFLFQKSIHLHFWAAGNSQLRS